MSKQASTIRVQVQHGNGAEWDTTAEFNAGPRNLLRAMKQLRKEVNFPGRNSVGGYGFRVLVGDEVLPFYNYPENLEEARWVLA